MALLPSNLSRLHGSRYQHEGGAPKGGPSLGGTPIPRGKASVVGAPAELGFATMAYRRCPQVTSLSWPWTRLEGGASVTASASTSSASKASASSASASASTASASKAPASNAPASKTVTSEASSSEASAPTSLGSRQSATGKSKPAAEHSPRATSATRHLDQSAELDTATQAPGAPGVYQGAARLEAAAVLGDGLWRAGAAAPGERVQAGATPVSGEIGDDGKSKVPRAGEPRVSRGRVRGGASSGGGGSRQTTPDTEKETVLLSDNPDAILLSSNPGVPPWLPPSPPVARPRATHNAAMLAYVGDSIYEMYARWHFLNPPVAIPGYCQRVMSVVCCEAQDLLLRRIQKAGFFTPEELDILRWGRNATTGARRAKGRAGISAYANATALETLVGFLYLSNTTRLHELMLALGFTCNSADLIVPASLYAKEKGATPPSSKAS